MKNRQTLLGFVASAALSMAAFASAPDLNLDYQKYTLDNGLTVIVHEDRKAPVVAVSVWYDVGSRDEPEGKTGFAHLFEHLMFNGSENYDGEYFVPFEEVGATDQNGTTWLDRTNYFQTVPTPALDMALWMESDRMGHFLGSLTQEKLDTQRGVVQNEKRQGDNQPYGRVNYNLYEGLFPKGHPYHHSTIGSMEDLEAASLETAKQWFVDYYGPNNAILVLAGDVSPEQGLELAKKYFGDIPAGPEVDKILAGVPDRTANTREFQFDEVPSVLNNRAWATPGLNERDSALLELAADVIGSGKNSRLYKEAIYDRQVATSVSFGFIPFVLASVADMSVTLKPEIDAETGHQIMDKVIAEFLETGPSPDELARAKSTINAGVIRGLEKVGGFGGKAVTLAQGELYSGDPLYIEKRLKWINEATPADVLAAARRWFSDGYHQVDVIPTPKYTSAPEGVDRSKGLPPVGAIANLTFPDVEIATLRNGIKIVLAKRDAVPIVRMAAQFDAGYAADAGGKLGVSSFGMAMLDEGAGKLSSLEIAAEAERLGAQISTGSNLDVSTVSLNALKSNLTESVNLWASIITSPTFADEEIERLRKRTISGIAQEKSQPVQLALRILPPKMYGSGHAYGVPFTGSGTEESVASLTKADLTNFHRTWIRPETMKLFIVGDTSMEEIKPLLEKALGKWSNGSGPAPVKNIETVAKPSAPKIAIIDKPGSPQSLILGGHVAPSTGAPDNLINDMMNTIIGGQFTARVNMNLREEKSWAYGAYTFTQAAKGQAPWLVYAPVQSDRTADSVKELLKEFADYRGARPATEEELARNKLNKVRELAGSFETGGDVLGSLQSSARFDRPYDYPATLPAQYEAMDLESVRKAAREIIEPNAILWVIVGDRAQIEAPLRDLGIADVVIWDQDGNPVE
jgi:zinc protease